MSSLLIKFFVYLFSFFCVSTSIEAATINGWDVQSEEIEIREKLRIEKEEMLYTGDVILMPIEDLPEKGKIYMMANLSIEKSKADTLTFSGKNIQLKIGNLYFDRIADDSFLTNHDIKPFTHLNLKRGIHNGTVIFEVPINLKDQKSSLVYKGINI